MGNAGKVVLVVDFFNLVDMEILGFAGEEVHQCEDWRKDAWGRK